MLYAVRCSVKHPNIPCFWRTGKKGVLAFLETWAVWHFWIQQTNKFWWPDYLQSWTDNVDGTKNNWRDKLYLKRKLKESQTFRSSPKSEAPCSCIYFNIPKEALSINYLTIDLLSMLTIAVSITELSAKPKCPLIDY